MFTPAGPHAGRRGKNLYGADLYGADLCGAIYPCWRLPDSKRMHFSSCITRYHLIQKGQRLSAAGPILILPLSHINACIPSHRKAAVPAGDAAVTSYSGSASTSQSGRMLSNPLQTYARSVCPSASETPAILQPSATVRLLLPAGMVTVFAV